MGLPPLDGGGRKVTIAWAVTCSDIADTGGSRCCCTDHEGLRHLRCRQIAAVAALVCINGAGPWAHKSQRPARRNRANACCERSESHGKGEAGRCHQCWGCSEILGSRICERDGLRLYCIYPHAPGGSHVVQDQCSARGSAAQRASVELYSGADSNAIGSTSPGCTTYWKTKLELPLPEK